MRSISKVLIGLILTLSCVIGLAQTKINPSTQINWAKLTGNGAPVATCPSVSVTVGTPYDDIFNNLPYVCLSNGWAQLPLGGMDTNAVHYNPATTNYVFTNSSQLVVASGSAADVTATAVSCDGSACTITAPNSYTSGQWVEMNWTYSPTCLQGALVQVLAAGLSGSQFKVNETPNNASISGCAGSQTGTGGTVVDATYFYPIQFGNMQYAKTHGSVIDLGQSAHTVADLDTNYTTNIHPYSPTVTGHAAYLFLMAGTQDWFNADSIANIQSHFASVMGKAHADGFIVIAHTWPVVDPGGSSVSDEVAINTWIRGQGKTVTLAANGKYWDSLIDAALILSNNHSAALFKSDHIHPSSEGANLLASAANNLLATGATDPPRSAVGTFDTPTSGIGEVGIPLTLEDSTYPGQKTFQFMYFDNSGVYAGWRFSGYIFSSPQQIGGSPASSGFYADVFPSYNGRCWNSGGASGMFAMVNAPDVCLWRDGAGVLDLGNGSGNDATGGLKLRYLYIQSVTSDPGAPVNGQLWYNSTTLSLNARINGVTVALGGSGGITALTGDGTASGTGSQPLILATVNSSPGSCGDATHVCQITTDGKGRTTAQSAVAITGIGGGISTLTGDVTATGSGSVAATLASVNANTGACGDSTHVCQVTLDAKGRATAATTVAITGATGISNIQIAMPTSSLAPGACSSYTATSMPGVVTTSTFSFTPSISTAGINGWDDGTLYIRAYPTADNANWKVCNSKSSTQTPGALTVNVSAK